MQRFSEIKTGDKVRVKGGFFTVATSAIPWNTPGHDGFHRPMGEVKYLNEQGSISTVPNHPDYVINLDEWQALNG